MAGTVGKRVISMMMIMMTKKTQIFACHSPGAGFDDDCGFALLDGLAGLPTRRYNNWHKYP